MATGHYLRGLHRKSKSQKSRSTAKAGSLQSRYVDAATQTTPPPEEKNMGFVCGTCFSRPFTFLKLPAEIRNMVYDLVFVSPAYIGATQGTLTKDFDKDATKWRKLAFAKTCRQVYEESANIFFAKNGFEFSYQNSCTKFLHVIGQDRRQLITKIRYISLVPGWPYNPLLLIRDCKNLEVLEIQIKIRSYATKLAWWIQSVQNPKELVFTDHSMIEWEEPHHVLLSPLRFGRAATTTPGFSESHSLEGRRTQIASTIESLRVQKRTDEKKIAAGKEVRIPSVLKPKQDKTKVTDS